MVTGSQIETSCKQVGLRNNREQSDGGLTSGKNKRQKKPSKTPRVKIRKYLPE
jgi:hypothetical protein